MQNHKSTGSYKGPAILLLTALIWGVGLSGQAQGMEFMGPLSFSACRITLGGVSMIPLALILDKMQKGKNPEYSPGAEYRKALRPAMICMPPLLGCIMFQQYGLQYTGAGKCAFITAFYIFLVPCMGLILGKKVSGRMWLAVAMAVFGLYMITMSSGFDNINRGDVLSFGAAVTYSIFIQAVDIYGEGVDTVKFSLMQFLAMGIICFVLAAVFEPGQITWEHYMGSIVPIAYTGIVACAGGYTLQILGQKYTDANKSAIILSSETVFSMLAGMILLHEVLLVREYVGCLIMCIAIAISVIPKRR